LNPNAKEMLVYAFCPRCKIDISIKTSAITRSELEDEQGLYITKRCQKCATKHDFHVNQIKAKVSPRGLKLTILLSIAFAFILIIILYWMGFWSTFTLALPVAIVYLFHNSQAKEATDFNSIKINRK